MTDKIILAKIEVIIEACEEAKKQFIPTYYETAEAVAYRHIVDLVKGEKDDTI